MKTTQELIEEAISKLPNCIEYAGDYSGRAYLDENLSKEILNTLATEVENAVLERVDIAVHSCLAHNDGDFDATKACIISKLPTTADHLRSKTKEE